MKRIICLGLLLLVGMAVGCVPEFVNPLPLSPNLKSDGALAGDWIGTEVNQGKTNEIRLFVLARSSGWMDFLYVTRNDAADPVNVLQLEGYVTDIEKNKFLSLRGVEEGKESATNKTWLIAGYTVSSKNLDISLFSQAKVKALVEDGTLKGINTDSDSVKVTSSSDELVAAITNKGLKAFVDEESIMRFSKSKK